MKTQRHLSEPARDVLAYLAARGTATSPELRALQQARNDGRSHMAHAALPYNMRMMGYIDQVPNSSPIRWELTTAGRAAAQALQPALPAQAGHTAPAPAEAAQPPTERHIDFAGRRVSLPKCPRWVFDLATGATP